MRSQAPGLHPKRKAETGSTSRLLPVRNWKVFRGLCDRSDCGREVERRPGEGGLSKEVNVVENNPQTAPNSEKLSRCGAREVPRSGGAVDFERLYQMHGRRVYRLCWKMVWDKADAEDLTQEVFIQLLRKIDTFRGESAFTTWLYRLTANVVLMGLRKKSRLESPLGEGEELGEASAHPPKELGDLGTAPVGAIDRLDMERAMAQLPPGFSQVFSLHDVEGYAHPEIARMLGISVGTSKSQLHKARLRLRALLRGAGSWHPQTDHERMSRNPVPPALVGRGVSKCRPLVLTPEGGSLRAAFTNSQLEVHPRGAAVHGTPSGNDEFDCLEVSYGKCKCA